LGHAAKHSKTKLKSRLIQNLPVLFLFCGPLRNIKLPVVCKRFLETRRCFDVPYTRHGRVAGPHDPS